MISHAAQTRLNFWSVALHQKPASEHFTFLGFHVGLANSMAPMGLYLREIMDPVGWKRNDAALLYYLLKEVVNLAGVASSWQIFELILLKTLNVLILCGVSIGLSWLNVLKASQEKKSVSYIIVRSVKLVILKELM